MRTGHSLLSHAAVEAIVGFSCAGVETKLCGLNDRSNTSYCICDVNSEKTGTKGESKRRRKKCNSKQGGASCLLVHSFLLFLLSYPFLSRSYWKSMMHCCSVCVQEHRSNELRQTVHSVAQASTALLLFWKFSFRFYMLHAHFCIRMSPCT